MISALKRYWWLFIGAILLGTLSGALLRGETQTSYESKALLSVAPPSVSPSTAESSSDRYVAGQLLVLGSESSAAAVAEAIGGGATAQSVLAMLTVVQAPSSDIVELTISSGDPVYSQKVGEAYVAQYFARLQQQIDSTTNASLAGIEDQLADLRQQLDTIDTQIAEAMAPYLPPVNDDNNAAYPPIPPIEQVVPDLVSQKQTLLDQFQNVSATKTEIELGSQLRVGSQVVQSPTLPTAALVSSNKKILIAGAFGGIFVGLLASVVAARISRKVLDDEEASEIVGHPLVGAMPAYHISSDRRALVEYLPAEATQFVDHLRVRLDALDRRRHALVVVVTGTDVDVGTTAVAGALANRFAMNGSDVIVLDADALHPELTELFQPDEASRRLTGHAAPITDARDVLRETQVSGLWVVAGTDLAEGAALRREDSVRALDLLDDLADVIIVDGGPFLGAASTVQFAHHADAAVLVIPRHRQLKQGLELVAGQLHEQQHNVLAVSTPTFRRHLTRFR